MNTCVDQNSLDYAAIHERMKTAVYMVLSMRRSIDARTKLLVTISDGRSDDQDGYRGSHRIEDAHQALIEARHEGVHAYCTTIDDEAMDYLPHMYGPSGFAVVRDIHNLPYKASDIYRRITR